MNLVMILAYFMDTAACVIARYGFLNLVQFAGRYALSYLLAFMIHNAGLIIVMAALAYLFMLRGVILWLKKKGK